MTQLNVKTPRSVALAERWQALVSDQPNLRIRDAATTLGVSELELLALDCGKNVIRLSGDFGDLIKDFSSLGRVMSLTRNESAVHERKGRFDKISIRGPMGLVLNKEIDLRMFMNHFVHGYAVTNMRDDGPLKSFQFFDESGEAVIKVYLTVDSDHTRYDELVKKYRSADQSKDVETVLLPTTEKPASERDIDVHELRNAWDQLRDVHDFAAMLKRFNVSRQQSFHLVGSPYCREVTGDSFWTMLNEAARLAMPIMVFVGNRGCIQIHSGPIRKVQRMGPWANVLDSDFNLHLREDQIAESWVVAKPTSDGLVTCLELLDAAGGTIAQIFSLRAEGLPEDESWRALLAKLPNK